MDVSPCLSPIYPPGTSPAARKLRESQLVGADSLEAPADLTTAIEREATLARLGAAFSRLPPAKQRRCACPVTGNGLIDTFVFVETEDISQQHIEGVVVGGERDDDGQWVLDGQVTVFTTDEELIRVSGWGCHVEIQ